MIINIDHSIFLECLHKVTLIYKVLNLEKKKYKKMERKYLNLKFILKNLKTLFMDYL